MTRLWMLLFLLLGAVASPAQERRASVELDSGQVLEGTVLAMDLASLRLQVGHEVKTIPATSIKSCRFETIAGTAAPDPSEARPSPAAASPTPAPRISWRQPLPDPVDPEAAEVLPHDLRSRSLLRARIEALDEAYPWLAPTAPTQWVSLGLLLAIALSLAIHLSVHVAGADTPSLGRSSALAGWHLVTAFLQVALVPVNDFSVAMMLLANATLALFWLCALFGLPRANATIAFAVQLGCVALGYGLLELVTALLGSIGVAV